MADPHRPLHQQRLVFHDHLAKVDRDPQVLAERLAQHYSLLDYGPRPGHERTFLHRTSTCQCGELVLSGGYTTPIQGQIGERQGVGSINLLLSGGVTYSSEGRTLSVHKQRPLFFSPGADYHYAIDDHFNGVVFQIDLDRLKRTAASIAGLGVSPRRFNGSLERVGATERRSQRSRELLQVLTKAFSLLDHPELEALGVLPCLELDDLIYRTLALLLCPQLEALAQQGPEQRSRRERVFDDLVEWARANLHRPINLSQLERRSGYSRRSLQLAFQQRFGCGPIQWIRQQRLEQARLALLRPGPDDQVASVAARFGFRSQAAFSREFRHHFGLPPSELLREGKGLRP
ncbi:MAG: helix-turn-helix domain-containing protein [Cyanobacteriota bacterium]